MKKLLLKIKESMISVMPISIIVLFLGLATGIPSDMIFRFIIGSFLLMLGMAFFSLGADVAMVPIGSLIGASLTKSKKILLSIFLCFLIGLIITIAEPALMVLANQLSGAFNKYIIIMTVGLGSGIFLILAMIRIIFQISLRKILLGFYALIFILAIFIPKEFFAIAFDSGGATTGPMTVPIIIALGIGIASSKAGNKIDDNFGMVAICSIGPVISILLLGLFSNTSGVSSEVFMVDLSSSNLLFLPFIKEVPHIIFEISIALLPIIIFFIVYNALVLKLPLKFIKRISFGLFYLFIGFVIFLTGVNIGFSPFGNLLAERIVVLGYQKMLIPIGVVMGFFVIVAEPAVHVLNEQIEEISSGVIKKKSIMTFLMIGMALALSISMIRILTGISIWWFILPGYAIALILTFFTPKVFTAIAFDSGGVVTGPMTVAFLLPFAIGASKAIGGNILADAFGLIAIVAMTPLVTIQLLGLASVIKKRNIKVEKIVLEEQIIDLDNDEVILEKPLIKDNVIDFDEPLEVKAEGNDII